MGKFLQSCCANNQLIIFPSVQKGTVHMYYTDTNDREYTRFANGYFSTSKESFGK